MEQIKKVKYGNITFNATYWAGQGKERFISYHLKRYKGRPIFATRDEKQQKEWLELMWQAIETETGVKAKETLSVKVDGSKEKK